MPRYKGLQEMLLLHFEKNDKAFFSKELEKDIPKQFSLKSLSWVLKHMVVDGEIVRSQRCLYTGTPKGFGYLYAKSIEPVNQRIRELEESWKEKPIYYVESKRRQHILDVLRSLNRGATSVELMELTRFKFKYLDNALREMWRRKLLLRSNFKIYIYFNGFNSTGAYVYALNKEQVLKGLLHYMPKEAVKAVKLVLGNCLVWSSWRLLEESKAEKNVLRSWMDKFTRAGLIKSEVVDSVTYFWDSSLEEKLVDGQLKEHIQKSKQFRLKMTGLGQLFEQKALFTFVKYLQSKEQDVKVSKEFPENIPSWLKKEDRQLFRDLDEASDYFEYTNNVWRFNSEPIDFIVFARDKLLGHTSTYVISCKASRNYGFGYFSSFVGCVRMGRTSRGHSIPNFLNAIPVFICNETLGQSIYRFNSDVKGRAGIILTLGKMRKLIEASGQEFPKEALFEEKRLFEQAKELYSNSKQVLLGKKSLEVMLKEKGFSAVGDASAVF